MKLPEKVVLTEVGPRDGFQNIQEWIPTSLKIEIINRLLESGFPKMEITSFVSPKAIPQMRDASEIVQSIEKSLKNTGSRCLPYVLVPNFTGAKIAGEAGIEHITYVFSVSETHNRENVRKSRKESLAELKKIRKELPALKVKAGLATAFDCPFEGRTPVDQVIEQIKWCLELGIEEICLCDTIGTANPRQTEELLAVLKECFPGFSFGFHFHDTRGMGLANILVALQYGYVSFEAAVGGLGGCPFAPGAAGNVASEDLVNMLESMGVKTGVELGKVMEVSRLIQEKIKPDLSGHLVKTNLKTNCLT